MTSARQTKAQLLERLAELQKSEAQRHLANQQLSHEIIARRQGEEWYRVLVESIHDMIWEVNQEGVFTYVSPIAKDMLGYTAEELIGRSCFEFMSAAERPHHRAMLKRSWPQDRACGMSRLRCSTRTDDAWCTRRTSCRFSPPTERAAAFTESSATSRTARTWRNPCSTATRNCRPSMTAWSMGC